ncbi:MAG: T9SS type A sorting domain-containing protein, partial [Fluviicola sp.]|nr:T9SS type A sorting domain-containing protein [Fluviicola sp.]
LSENGLSKKVVTFIHVILFAKLKLHESGKSFRGNPAFCKKFYRTLVIFKSEYIYSYFRCGLIKVINPFLTPFKSIIMKHFLTIAFVLSIQYLFCQYGDLGIKQRFDNVYNVLYGPIYNPSSSTNDCIAQGSLTWNKSQLYSSIASEAELASDRSGSLEALLVMYEATCDIKYLWEFMEQTTIIVQNRADKVTPQQSGWPYWFRELTTYHGRLLSPFAKFVYLIKSQQLENTQILKSQRGNFANHASFGQFAAWLNTSNIEVMDFLEGRLWRGNDECMCKPNDGTYGDGIPNISRVCANGQMDGTTTKQIMELNFQAPYGCALIYMYLANPTRTDYGVMAVEMARAYLTSKGGILDYISMHNAYIWYHDGWQWERPNTSSTWRFSTDFREDIGHGGFDIMFPILYNKFYSKITGTITAGQYFEDYQMVRFKNTFSKIIYNDNTTVSQPYLFGCSVVYHCNNVSDGGTQESYQSNPKLWMDLYKFDNTPGSYGPKVYDILMQYYEDVESTCAINALNFGGINIKGLADMCAANYKKEGLNTGCSTKSAQATFESESIFSARISPNPTNEFVTITSDEHIKEVKIYDLNGTLLIATTNVENISLAELTDGIYLVKIYSETGVVNTQRLAVTK